ncbi:MAG: hypothetical protein WCW14_01440 [Candidatus Paceibacterota bacterium]|jgi:hypothetical protein
MNTNEFPKQTADIDVQKGLEKIDGVEKREGVPINVIDSRDPSDTAFDLGKFLNVFERLKREGLFKIRGEFAESDYGKFMAVFASCESDNWDEAVQNAKAIQITLTTQPNRGHEFMEGITNVEIKILMDEREGRVFNFRFKDGKYRSGRWTDVHLQKRLGPTFQDVNTDFSLDIDADEPRKLK